MSIDILQDKIRKTKNPSVLDLSIAVSELPPHLLAEEGSASGAYKRFCAEMLTALKGVVPAVRVGFAPFALLGTDGLTVMSEVLKSAREQGYYVVLEAPELWSPAMAKATADAVFAEEATYPCDGLIINAYPGSDMIKPFLPYCKKGKDIFCVVRTSNKSAPEIQDLLSGTRLVHMAAADIINRFGSDNTGKSGYARVAIMAGANSAESLKSLRMKYPRLFVLLDAMDYPNCNAKICSHAFDKFGHGAAACVGSSVLHAWKQTESDGIDYIVHAQAAAERMKKNLTRYITIL